MTELKIPSADGTPIHARVEGAGEPSLVFLHGWLGNADWWGAPMRRFASRHRVVAVDLAGHGRSGSRATWTIPAFAADVEAVARHLDLRRVVLFGHSMSGFVALESRVDLEMIVPVDTLHDVEWTATPAMREELLEPFRRDYAGTLPGFLRERGAPDRVVEEGLRHKPGPAIAILAAIAEYQPLAAFSRVRVPIRAINSDRYPTKIETNRKYADYDVTTLPGVGHWPMLERPEEFCDAVEAVTRSSARRPR